MERKRGRQEDDGRRNIIGTRLREARLGAAPPLSMATLSRRLLLEYNVDLSANAIAKIEHGTRYANDYEVAAVARALNIRGDWFLGLTEHPQP
ncbi:helix-turn-helix domain-containing protein [Deinococcus oregonensis]|uniref:Helix-turn-helix domain-containing protein n=1 Tax=Deinococcus oregonensis TaxID=1805970 RepID=A0ABV6B1Z8_9DEIO